MRVKTVINYAHWVLTIMLLAFFWLNHHPDPRAGDHLQNIRKINSGLWLYSTQNNDGGATVATVFRYYLLDKDGAGMQQLRDTLPFITGKGSISSVKVDGEHVYINYSGEVYSIERKTGRYFLSYMIN